MDDATARAVEMQQPRGRAVCRRLLRNELSGEIEVEVAYLHALGWGLTPIRGAPAEWGSDPIQNAPRSNRPRSTSSGFHRSPSFATRAGTFSTVKFSMRIPRSTSFHVTGVDTVASGRGRGE